MIRHAPENRCGNRGYVMRRGRIGGAIGPGLMREHQRVPGPDHYEGVANDRS